MASQATKIDEVAKTRHKIKIEENSSVFVRLHCLPVDTKNVYSNF